MSDSDFDQVYLYVLFGLCLVLPYICVFITLSHLPYLAGDSVAI